MSLPIAITELIRTLIPTDTESLVTTPYRIHTPLKDIAVNQTQYMEVRYDTSDARAIIECIISTLIGTGSYTRIDNDVAVHVGGLGSYSFTFRTFFEVHDFLAYPTTDGKTVLQIRIIPFINMIKLGR